MQQGGPGEVAPDRKHHDDGNNASSVGDEKRGEDAGGSTHGNAPTTETDKTAGGRSKTTPQNGAPQTAKNKIDTTRGALHHRNDAGGQNCVTVIFHALLTPTFTINFNQGDKLVLRGDPPFSWNVGKQIQMRFVRLVCSSFNVLIMIHSLLRKIFYFAFFRLASSKAMTPQMFYFQILSSLIPNGYYLLEGETKLSLQEAKRKTAYKYVVVRSQGKDLWEFLIGVRPIVPAYVNRCLNIPEKSVKSNGRFLDRLQLNLCNIAYVFSTTSRYLRL